MDEIGEYLRSIDEGLMTYKDEFLKLAVRNDATLKYVRPYEVEDMNIPRVYRRMLVDRIVNLQTPDTKAKLKEKCMEDFSIRGEKSGVATVGPKRLKFEDTSDSLRPTQNTEQVQQRAESTSRSQETGNFLENEVARLDEERDTLSLLLVHKKDELCELKRKPNPPAAIGIPGNGMTKSSCDNCHRKGHRSTLNRGNKSCPYRIRCVA
jgi:hypothetical protein